MPSFNFLALKLFVDKNLRKIIRVQFRLLVNSKRYRNSFGSICRGVYDGDNRLMQLGRVYYRDYADKESEWLVGIPLLAWWTWSLIAPVPRGFEQLIVSLRAELHSGPGRAFINCTQLSEQTRPDPGGILSTLSLFTLTNHFKNAKMFGNSFKIC